MATGGRRHRVLIAGGGVAAVELAACLVARASDRVTIELLAPDVSFRARPWEADPQSALDAGGELPLARVATALGASLVADHLAWVAPAAQVVYTATGRRLSYDSLAVCVGTSLSDRHPAALTFEASDDVRLRGLLDAVSAGQVRRIALVAGERPGWPLPLYELALALAGPGGGDPPPEVTVFTAEHRPLQMFGSVVSHAVAQLLRERGVTLFAGAQCDVPVAGRVVLGRGQQPYADARAPGRTHDFDVVVALPELHGPLLRGLPAAPHGFIPIDRHCHVPGVPGVFAAGDATAFPVKHGGLAAQQADIAAAGIAARAGVDVVPETFRPRLQGVLRTGKDPLYIRCDLVGGRPFGSQASHRPLWPGDEKVVAAHIAPVLLRARS